MENGVSDNSAEYEAVDAFPVGGEREPAPKLLPIHMPSAAEVAAAPPGVDPNALAYPLGPDGDAGRAMVIAPSHPAGPAVPRLPPLSPHALDYLPRGGLPRRALAGETMSEDPARAGAHLLGLSAILIPTCSFIGYRLGGLYGAGAGTLTGGALVNLARAAWSPGPERAVSITYGLVGLAAAGYLTHYAYKHKHRGII